MLNRKKEKNFDNAFEDAFEDKRDMIIFDLDDTLYDRFGTLPDNLMGIDKIKVYPGVKEFLREEKNFIKVLVTKGNKFLQQKKLEILGLKFDFDIVAVCETNKEKKSAFQSIIKKHPSKKIYVVGDRVDSEIRYANELGLVTVLISKGKYKNLKAKGSDDIPNYCFQSFQEMVDKLFNK